MVTLLRVLRFCDWMSLDYISLCVPGPCFLTTTIQRCHSNHILSVSLARDDIDPVSIAT